MPTMVILLCTIMILLLTVVTLPDKNDYGKFFKFVYTLSMRSKRKTKRANQGTSKILEACTRTRRHNPRYTI